MLAWRFRTKIFETFCCRILLVQCKIIAFGFLNKEKKMLLDSGDNNA